MILDVAIVVIPLVIFGLVIYKIDELVTWATAHDLI